MKKIAIALGAVALSASAVHAAGIERSRLAYGTLFETGTYLEFGASRVSPSVSGNYSNPAFGTTTGSMAKDYTTLSFSFKHDINDKLAYGVFVNTPYGALSSYDSGLYSGLEAEWKSRQAAVLFKYKTSPNISVYGGLKAVRSQATIDIPNSLIAGGLVRAQAVGAAPGATPEQVAAGATAGAILTATGGTGLEYSAFGPADTRLGYIIGAAYEKPEIALRVALTYESGISHKFRTTETSIIPGIARTDITNIDLPESLTLDFQTGVAKDTLVFGSIRYAKWSVWEVRPTGYDALTSANITDFADNVTSFQLGVGRRINDQFSAFIRAGYEKSNSGASSRLSPINGLRSIGVGGSYTHENMKITAGLEYVKLGDAVDASGTRFAGNEAVGLGVSVGYRF
ncbi:OmpP1/FadL family transporter [Pseudorhodobacter aquimaris]|uniref:OmpP1/FadL family transporter n=1 Tax=Pseudorhodobacter aquimaris TaxID=687412 RepID=UPI00067CC401|nr:outer membrane protein transport protein [Pseudorhodobacter aquimaris]